jgi:hypothetical protein
MTTRVVHCKRSTYDVYIGRPSKWGNPFRLTKDQPREVCMAKYREWLMGQPELLAALGELRGKVLGCWCKPLACHGDILAELADATPSGQIRKRAKTAERNAGRRRRTTPSG